MRIRYPSTIYLGGLAFYSLVTYPEKDQISAILKPAYDKLSQVDSRNDG